MEPQLQQTIQSDSVYKELERIDRALHRIRERLACPFVRKNMRQEILLKTGGILQKKYTKKSILSWQRKVRDEWGS